MMNQDTFSALADQYMDMVYRVAYHALRSPHDADDVTQEVFLRLLRAGPAFGSEAHAKHWLIRVTLNESKRLLCSPWRRHTAPLADYEASLSWETPEQEDLFQAVMNLPRKYRLPLYLYYYEGYAVREIAQLLRRKPSTVQTQLARGREQLKHILQEEWSYE